ncbi:hypothetical protein DH86_00000355 [Scytalidium sp. 3C]|nr:hypothetical protein DH86_00000355 [Scytalidium sp. 3C]
MHASTMSSTSMLRLAARAANQQTSFFRSNALRALTPRSSSSGALFAVMATSTGSTMSFSSTARASEGHQEETFEEFTASLKFSGSGRNINFVIAEIENNHHGILSEQSTSLNIRNCELEMSIWSIDPSFADVAFYFCRYEKEFENVQDVFELQRNLNNAFAYDLVPSPSVIVAALKAARRVNDFPTAVRIFEGIKAKVENRGQYDQYLQELAPLREELGVVLKEELYPESK